MRGIGEPKPRDNLQKEVRIRLIDADDRQDGELDGIRTHDPMIKSHVLYQLSYELSPPLSRKNPTTRMPCLIVTGRQAET